MPDFYLPNETHTLACVLRAALEAQNPDSLVACTLLHPLDDFLRVTAPSEASVRTALLSVKEDLAAVRAAL